MKMNELRKSINENKKIALYGAGAVGYTFYRILKKADFPVSCFIDSNKTKRNKCVYDNIICLEADEIKDKENYIVFISVNSELYTEVYDIAKIQGFAYVYNSITIINDILNQDIKLYEELIKELPYGPIADVFYESNPNIKLLNTNSLNRRGNTINQNSKIAVYTAIFGNYDNLLEITDKEVNVDYYLISDKKPNKTNGYVWLDACKYIPNEINNPILKNRYVKMHPHKLFPMYDYSIYIDGNVKIVNKVRKLIRSTSTGIGAFLHPRRDCIYIEALAALCFGKAKSKDVYLQVNQYLEEGFPKHYGLLEMMVIVREHNNPICIKIMEHWWRSFLTGSNRDQLSFMYVIWKHGFSINDINILGNNIRESEMFELVKHV